MQRRGLQADVSGFIMRSIMEDKPLLGTPRNPFDSFGVLCRVLEPVDFRGCAYVAQLLLGTNNPNDDLSSLLVTVAALCYA